MPSNFDRELKEKLLAAGCSYVRHAKGSHDLWVSPLSGRHFVVPEDIRSRHTANAILKQAGLPKAF
ncbi:MAG: type II toxin-antitoxin system HicA family toxin [Parvibaculum sp.]|jgi:predicted RNA binding protein YcfA (HicA-like mRNA interferase family)|uniref:type II toxin-antitoxin system HicA family toxin n=1 Tax=Parvibaculum sp. TaxID=2024848 RepID=UPI002AB83DA7|nr:type II toxin-antitoxin system HicA family toxin [Parvibaculum sp.]MDZ4382656.1 type II toxin-antitoxin system HicA family toxin [Parvibaculum sp.]